MDNNTLYGFPGTKTCKVCQETVSKWCPKCQQAMVPVRIWYTGDKCEDRCSGCGSTLWKGPGVHPQQSAGVGAAVPFSTPIVEPKISPMPGTAAEAIAQIFGD